MNVARFLACLALGFVLGLVLFGCKVEKNNARVGPPVEHNVVKDDDPNLGMTFGGRLGLEVAPGLVCGVGGCGLGFGF